MILFWIMLKVDIIMLKVDNANIERCMRLGSRGLY